MNTVSCLKFNSNLHRTDQFSQYLNEREMKLSIKPSSAKSSPNKMLQRREWLTNKFKTKQLKSEHLCSRSHDSPLHWVHLDQQQCDRYKVFVSNSRNIVEFHAVYFGEQYGRTFDWNPWIVLTFKCRTIAVVKIRWWMIMTGNFYLRWWIDGQEKDQSGHFTFAFFLDVNGAIFPCLSLICVKSLQIPWKHQQMISRFQFFLLLCCSPSYIFSIYLSLSLCWSILLLLPVWRRFFCFKQKHTCFALVWYLLNCNEKVYKTVVWIQLNSNEMNSIRIHGMCCVIDV